MFRCSFSATPLHRSRIELRIPRALEASGSKEEDCSLFRCVKIKHTDLGFATASSSSVFLSWILFDMVVAFSRERKWLRDDTDKIMMLNRQRRWFHSSRVKLALVNMSTSWFLVSTYLIWICGSKLILSKNPTKRNSMGSGHVSHRKTSAFNNHLDYCFIVLEKIKQDAEVTKFCG